MCEHLPEFLATLVLANKSYSNESAAGLTHNYIKNIKFADKYITMYKYYKDSKENTDTKAGH